MASVRVTVHKYRGRKVLLDVVQWIDRDPDRNRALEAAVDLARDREYPDGHKITIEGALGKFEFRVAHVADMIGVKVL